MRKVTREDIKNIADYELARPEFRRNLIQLKKTRRVAVGNYLTFVFENRATVLYQIQEMMRAERIVDEARIQQEIDVYNELVPADGELSATMFIEISDQELLLKTLPKLIGIEESVHLKIGDSWAVRGDYERGRSKEDKTSTVHYIKFPFTSEQVEAFQDESYDVKLVVSHPNYSAWTLLGPQVRQSLAEDLHH